MRLSVVCYLDEESSAIVRNVQGTLSDLTGAKASLNVWLPHITVGDGVEVNDSELSALTRDFDSLANDTDAFSVDLHDILKIDFRKGGEGETTTPYGLYLDVKPNKELLELVNNVSILCKQFKKWYLMPRPYHPHCALAFKDLSKEGYAIGGEYLDRQDLKLRTRIASLSIVEMLPDETRELARFNLA